MSVFSVEPDNNEKYLNLITSEFESRPLYYKFVDTFLKKVSDTVNCLNTFDGKFNLETATGDQLDKLGQLVALTRELPINDPSIPPILTDDLFMAVIKARILSNYWDGTLFGFQKIIETMFPGAAFQIIDGQNMTMQVVIIVPNASSAMLALLFNGYIVPKPSGVRLTWTVQESPLFGWGTDTSFIKGWGGGVWTDN